MSWVGIWAISLLAALAAAPTASLIVLGYVDQGSLGPLYFMVPGSLLILGPLFYIFERRAVTVLVCYVSVLLTGSAVGALLFYMFSVDPLYFALRGGFFGFATGAWWIVLHFVTVRLSGRQSHRLI